MSPRFGLTRTAHTLDHLAQVALSVGHVSVRIAHWPDDGVNVMVDDRNPRHATVYLREGANPNELGEVIGEALEGIEQSDRDRRRAGIEPVPELECDEPAHDEVMSATGTDDELPIPHPRLRVVSED